MIKNKTDMLDPTVESRLTDYEKQVVKDAQNAGNSPEFVSTDEDEKGILRQTVSPQAIEAGDSKAEGGDSDVSGGVANTDENTSAGAVGQNEYNR